MQKQLNKHNKQQGYILVVALLAMLFIGAIFISSTDRSGTEERLAISQLHAASLESALYAGLYQVEKKATADDKIKSADEACTLTKNKLNEELLGKEEIFQEATKEAPAIYWKLEKLDSCKDYAGANKRVEKEFGFKLIAWQGDENKPISRIEGEGTIFIKDTSVSGEKDCPVNEPNCRAGIIPRLANILDNSAATSSGAITATGGAKIFGNTAGNKIKVDGGAEVIGGNLAYQELEVPSWYQWKDEDDFWYNLAEKNELADAIKVDPLGLKKGVDESFHTDESGKKIPLTGLTKTRVKDEFNRLPGGKKVEIGQWPFQRATLKPTRLEVYNDDHRAKTNQIVTLPFYQPVSFLGEDIALMALDEFKIKSGGKDPSLTISGGRVILFIDGDVEMDGGASMQIDSDSSLTLIVTGKFTLTGGFEFLNKNAVNDYGEPLFTLLSSNTNLTSAVQITGGTKLYGVVYSLSDLNLGGSGTIVGQAFAANINANGGTAIDYQPAFGSGSSDEDTGGSDGSKFEAELDSDFQIIY